MSEETHGLDPSQQADFATEIERLHRFFEDWFCGRGERRIEEFADAMAAEFVIVPPSGEVFDRRGIVDLVEQARASRSIEIEVVNPRLRYLGEVAIGTYEEHQRTDDGLTRRISTVVMRPDEQAPGGWTWLAVHETWLPPESDA